MAAPEPKRHRYERNRAARRAANAARPVGPAKPVTIKQLRLLQRLARQVGREYEIPATRAEASLQIELFMALARRRKQ